MYSLFTWKQFYNYPSDCKWYKLENTTFPSDWSYQSQQRDKWQNRGEISLLSIMAARKRERKNKKT